MLKIIKFNNSNNNYLIKNKNTIINHILNKKFYCTNNKEKNLLFSFGSFDNLKLGLPGNEDKLYPQQITHLPPFLKIKQIGTSWLNSFLLTDESSTSTSLTTTTNKPVSNKVYMWGTNKSGNMALPSDHYRFPTLVDILKEANVEKVVGGRSYSLVLTSKHYYFNEGKVLGFGENNFGQIGTGDIHNKTVPTLVENLDQFRVIDVDVGLDHSLVVTSSGHVFGWGYNVEGQIGQKVVEYTRVQSSTDQLPGEDSLEGQMVADVEYSSPTLVPGLEKVKISKVFCGYDSSFLLSARGNVYAFGSNEVGSLGLGGDHIGRVVTPTKVKLPEKIQQISSGSSHTLFLGNSGNVYGCGWGSEGRLGLGDNTSNRNEPVLLNYFKDNNIRIIKVSAGGSHSLALDDQGNVYSWGNGSNGKLGHGDEKDCHLPTKINYFQNLFCLDIFSGIDNSLVLSKER
ncbi:hypothetical protein DICPUDRAFT_147589 [Dictyostelium purpureum]|uniref:RCC1-like domain-containing protein n=1 Tax=Dictyostelium purpureum TaxID=5786 RepID=F0Z8W2_DICPU|nr:uncharacterized protein DICPUDRAFT_147589 [Dictyostelium purpureum]EGC39646.1 hypothetical protein DICPUDRAFT_147589 [Dictyostelium purpureum]|eukprot:XP_003283867.1 hypothetical protein DICPUDRAFT_147589 [Dictyostelium purpureum]